MSGWSSDYSKHPRLFKGKCVTPKPVFKVSIERQRSKSGQSMIINTRHKKPEIPVPAVIPPWPATTPSRPPGKVCYCVERSAEQHFFSCIASLTDHTKFPRQDWRWLIWQASSITCRHRLAERSYKQPGGFAHGHPFSHWGRNTVESQQQNGTPFCSTHPPT